MPSASVRKNTVQEEEEEDKEDEEDDEGECEPPDAMGREGAVSAISGCQSESELTWIFG